MMLLFLITRLILFFPFNHGMGHGVYHDDGLAHRLVISVVLDLGGQ